MKTLMIGHGCNPYTGSEPGLTFNWAAHMSDYCAVHLISQPQNRAETERFLAENPRPNLRMHWVDVDSPLDYWSPNRGDRGIRFHYLLWLRNVEKYARKLQESEQFDLVHHVGWGTVSVPSPFWKLGAPLIWGPLGGGQTTPRGLMGIYGRRRWEESLRTFRVRILRFTPSFRRSVARSSVAIAANRESACLLSSAGVRTVTMLPDSALRNDSYPDEFEHSSTPDRLNLLWAGKLLRWKGLDLALIAMKDLGVKARVHLTVAGDGPLTRDFESTVKRLGLRDIVTFRGRVPWLEMSKEFLRADAFLFTSLRDSFGSVALEATSYGLPIVTLDIGGAGTFLPAGAAIKIKPSSVKGTASALAGAILRLRDDPSLRHGMGLAARRFAESMSWEQHAAIMWQIYQGVSGVPDGLRISAQNESPHNSQ